MNVSVYDLRDWLLLAFGLLCWDGCLWYWLFGNMSSYFSHEFLLFLSLLHFILVDFWLCRLLFLLVVLRLCLSKVAIKLISSWTALLVILIFFLILNVAKVILSLILPERVFIFLFFPVHEVVHFGTSPFSEAHLFDGVVFGRQWLWWWLFIAVLLIGPFFILLALRILSIFRLLILVVLVWGLPVIDILFIFIQLRFLRLLFFPFLQVYFLLFGFLFRWDYFFCLFLYLWSGFFSCHCDYKLCNIFLV